MDRVSVIVERELSSLPRSVEIRLEFPDFARWQLQLKRADGRPIAIPSVEVNSAYASITVTLYEPFLAEFNQPKNVAEQSIVTALITGAERLSGIMLDDENRRAFASEVMGNEDARFFHIIETRLMEHMVRSPFRAKPLLVGDEDLAAAQIGLAKREDGLPAVPSEDGSETLGTYRRATQIL
jgi:hypothetical protein